MSKTLVCTQNFLPYMKGDVFTVTDEEWKAIEGETPEKGRDLKTSPLVHNCVVEYDPNKKEHVELLVAQRGKTEDAEPAKDKSSEVADLKAKLAQAEAARDAALRAKDKPKA